MRAAYLRIKGMPNVTSEIKPELEFRCDSILKPKSNKPHVLAVYGEN